MNHSRLDPAGPNREAPDPEALFHAARALPVEERDGWLSQACAGSPGVRSLVARLLQREPELGNFLGGAESVRPAPDKPGERQGDRIDRYVLRERIGEGGFGTVWMAEQVDPVRRMVALKIIKLGMDTRQVIARFEAERQALALMDHPSIARVLDGGATAAGRPYFVMELVKGVPITEFCHAESLSIRSRIELLVEVCAAIRHAHQKGVIHRDIKPSNILVTHYDGRPVPKVIDFGVAKATAVELTQKTLFTGYRQIVGTPEYMAPEQAATSALDVDTRADVYSLGVLLYEVLSGCHPFDLDAARAQGYEALLQTLRDTEPPPPSVRFATSRSTTTAPRTTDASGWVRQLRGDLDWIVVRAMAKDRRRRYQSADELGQDLRRFLSGQPVEARPPSRLYRWRRFAHRYRVALATGSAIVLALTVGVILATVGLLEARSQRDEAVVLGKRLEAVGRELQQERDAAREERDTAQSVTGFLVDMLGVTNPDITQVANVSAADLLDQAVARIDAAFVGRPDAELQVRTVIGESLMALGRPQAAEQQLRRAAILVGQLRRPAPAMNYRVLWAYWQVALETDSFQKVWTLERLLPAAESRVAGDDAELDQALRGLRRQSVRSAGDEALAELLQLADQRLGDDPERWLTLADLLVIYTDEATRDCSHLIRAALTIYTERLGLAPTHSRVTRGRTVLQRHLQSESVGLYAQSAAEAEATIAALRDFLPENHWFLARCRLYLGRALVKTADFQAAEPILRSALRALESSTRPEARSALAARLALFEGLLDADRRAEAADLRPGIAHSVLASADTPSMAAVELLLGVEFQDVATALRDLQDSQFRPLEAEARLGDGLALCRERFLPDDPRGAVAAVFLSHCAHALTGSGATSAWMVEVFDEAIHRLEATGHADRIGPPHWLRADWLQFLGDSVGAEESARICLRTGSDQPAYLASYERQLGLALCGQNRFEEGLPRLRQGYENLVRHVGPLNINTEQAFRHLVDQLCRAGRRAEALRACEERLTQLPEDRDSLQARWLMADVLIGRLGRDDRAAELATWFEQRFPGNQEGPRLRAWLAALHFEAEAFDRHRGAMPEHLRSAPGYLLAQAPLLARLGRRDAALQAARDAHARWNSGRAALAAGVVRLQFGELDAAERVFLDDLASWPAHRDPGAITQGGWDLHGGFDAHSGLAQVALRRGQHRRALEAARKSHAISHWGGWALAPALAANDLPAVESFENAWQINRPGGDGFWSAYGLALDREGRFDEARRLLEQQTRDWPVEPFAWNARAWVLATAASATDADRGDAIRIARRAVDLSRRRSPVILATLAESHFQRGDSRQAVELAEEVVRMLDGKNGCWITMEEARRRLERYRG